MGKVNSSSHSEQPEGSDLAQPALFTAGSLGELLELLRLFDAADSAAPVPEVSPIEAALPQTTSPASDDPDGQ